MTEPPHPYQGNVITYLDTADPEEGQFRRAVVVGVGVTDPETDVIWVPVVRPDCELTLIDPGLIVPSMTSISDLASGQDRMPSPVDLLAGALSTLACELTDIDEQEPTALRAVRDLLTRFVDTIAPVDEALRALVIAAPRGGLAMVLSCIGSAAAEFELGRLALGKAAILRANLAMVELAAPDPDES
jgi:hypothetical protein